MGKLGALRLVSERQCMMTEFLVALAFPVMQILGLYVLGMVFRVDRKDSDR